MSMQSFEFDESTIHGTSAMDRPGSGNARARRKEEKRNNGRMNGSPYGANPVNPRQAWLNSMNQGQSFNNMASSGYGLKEPINAPSKPRTKPVNRASHLDKEEMYDEIQRLKELIAAFTKEKGLRQTRITKLEKELGKKDKLLEQTYSQTQSTYGPVSERSYGSTSIETNSTITGLRQKCHKYECLLRDKENEIKTMKSDLKSTRLQELEIMCDTYYQEITRLTMVMEQRPDQGSRVVTPRASTPRASTPVHGSEREKILEAKLQKLEFDNSTLKKQIMKTTTQTIGDSTGLISEYASLSRTDLEEQHQQNSKELFDAKLTIGELKTSSAVAEETIKQFKSQQTKNSENLEKLVDDRGALERKLASVDGEHQAQKLVIRRLNKTVRQHEDEVEKLKKQGDREQANLKVRLTDKTKIITKLEKEIEGLKEQIAEFEIKETKSEHKDVASARPKKMSQPVDKESIPKTNKKPVKKEIQEKKIEMKSEHENENKKTDSEAERETKRKNFKISEEEQRKEREEAAARKIQKNYRNHSLANSVSLLQRVLRGHALRCKVAKEEHNQSAEIIQSTLKGFAVKSQHVESLRKESEGIKVTAETQKVQHSAPARTKNFPERKNQKSVVSRTVPIAKKPDAGRNTKKDETPLKASAKRAEPKPIAKSSTAVSNRKVPVDQSETSSDEDDLIMM
ncbi:IQ domain-containing protein E-like [Bolinopsis microptera]|uniref:IQ domain-containing protein E-like n=1 Tax=Bolinopsis microptera TaxID=2820187 RepID=UPI003079B9E4